MLGADRRIGSAAQGSGFRRPAEISLCIACLSCLGDNFGVINMPFPPADTFFFVRKCSDILCLKLAWQLWLETDRYPVATHCSHTDLENKAVSEDLGIVSPQTQQGSLVYCSTQHTKATPHTMHTVHELHSADLWRAKKYTSLAT